MATDHYIPQFLLKQFATPEGGENLCVWDKEADRVFYPKIKDFGVENFHTFVDDGGPLFVAEDDSIEAMLGNEVEAPAAPIIARVIRNSNLEMTGEERERLITFVVLQYLRTPGYLQEPEAMVHRMLDAIDADEAVDVEDTDVPISTRSFKKVIKATGSVTKPRDLRNFKIASIPIDLINLSTIMMRADIALMTSDEDLMIGDDPVVIQRAPDQSGFVGYEITREGRDVILPLSRRHALYLFTAPGAQTGGVGKTLNAPFSLNQEGSGFLNRLQYRKAVRYVILSREEQRDMLDTDMTESDENYFVFRSLFER